jgi:anion-transporting  ArsA/GET3 family ATPase
VTPAVPQDLAELVATSSILICSGSGGVGKTTTSAVLAMEAAQLGRRAVVVTIDPAKRLADALGLGGEGLGNEPRQITGPWDGELWAVMLDTKTTFDDLVGRYASDPDQAERILHNRFYKNISGALSGTQEYMAAEKLYELHHDEGFELVVVDTPPSRNALDFGEAPTRLTRFLDHRLYRVLMAPTRGVMKAVNVAAQAFVRQVSKVVGAEVFDDAITFFQAFEGMETGFKERAAKVLDLLASPVTSYVLVASPKRDTVAEAQYFAEQLADAGIPIAALIVNRMHPNFTDAFPEALRERAVTFGSSGLGGLYRNLADFALVAHREEEHLAGLTEMVAPAPVVRVPFLRTDVHDLEGLGVVGDHLFHRIDPTG